MNAPFSRFVRFLSSLVTPAKPKPPRVYRPPVDQSSDEVVGILVDLANTYGEPFRAVLDGIEMIAKPGEDPHQIQFTWTVCKSKEDAVRERAARERAKHTENYLSIREYILKNGPKRMTLRDETAWNLELERAKGTCLASTLAYADEWARIMERCLTNGYTIESCAEQTSHIVCNVGGNEYHIAIRILIRTWIHGEELRDWHEKRYPSRTTE